MPSYHDLRIGESLILEGQGHATLTLREKSGQRARLEIEATAGMSILPVVAVEPPGGTRPRRVMALPEASNEPQGPDHGGAAPTDKAPLVGRWGRRSDEKAEQKASEPDPAANGGGRVLAFPPRPRLRLTRVPSLLPPDTVA